MKTAEVFYNNKKAGVLIENDDRTYSFRYASDYLMDPHNPAISLTLPKQKEEFNSPYLFPFFFNLIAEGANLSLQSRYLKVDKRDSFSILCATACFDAIGPVTVKLIEPK
jgi:serine/threonine-protein kinase HipA